MQTQSAISPKQLQGRPTTSKLWSETSTGREGTEQEIGTSKQEKTMMVEKVIRAAALVKKLIWLHDNDNHGKSVTKVSNLITINQTILRNKNTDLVL